MEETQDYLNRFMSPEESPAASSSISSQLPSSTATPAGPSLSAAAPALPPPPQSSTSVYHEFDGNLDLDETQQQSSEGNETLAAGTTQLETPATTADDNDVERQSEHRSEREQSIAGVVVEIQAVSPPNGTLEESDDEMDEQEVTPRRHQQQQSTTGVPRHEPISRVLAKWKELGLFPATATSCSASRADLFFDDGSVGTFDFKQLRRCCLRPGDRVKLRTDLPSSSSYSDEEYQVLSNLVDVELDPMTLIDVRGSRGDLTVPTSDIWIPPSLSNQFYDRRLDQKDWQYTNSGYDLQPLPAPTISSFSKRSNKRKRARDGVFERTAFILTSGASPSVPTTSSKANGAGARGTKKRALALASTTLAGGSTTSVASSIKGELEDEIERAGGTCADVHSLVAVLGRTGGRIVVGPAPLVDLTSIDCVFLLSQGPATTPKYLSALAAGIPCLHSSFVAHAIQTDTIDNWRQFLLPAGSVTSLSTGDILGAQSRFLDSPSAPPGPFDLLKKRESRVFAERSFLLSTSSAASPSASTMTTTSSTGGTDAKQFQTMWRTILACAGARKVDFVKDAQMLLDEEEELEDEQHDAVYDYLVVDDRSFAKRQGSMTTSGTNRLRSVGWLKECLILGSLVAA